MKRRIGSSKDVSVSYLWYHREFLQNRMDFLKDHKILSVKLKTSSSNYCFDCMIQKFSLPQESEITKLHRVTSGLLTKENDFCFEICPFSFSCLRNVNLLRIKIPKSYSFLFIQQIQTILCFGRREHFARMDQCVC